MTKYVIGPDVAIRLAQSQSVIPQEHRLLAPTLFRSQLLSLLFQAVEQGKATRAAADRVLDYVRRLQIRFLGDQVLQRNAWQIAEQLQWPDTFNAEYVALTRLQADAFVTLDENLARAVKELVTVAPFASLLDSRQQ